MSEGHADEGVSWVFVRSIYHDAGDPTRSNWAGSSLVGERERGINEVRIGSGYVVLWRGGSYRWTGS